MCPSPTADPVSESVLRPLDPKLLSVLVENHRGFLSFLSKRVGSPEVAEDLLQQSLRKALEVPPKTQEETTVVAWFFRILKNTLIDYYRSKAREMKGQDAFLRSLEDMGKDQNDASNELEAEVCQCMNQLLQTLKAEYADLLHRIDLQGDDLTTVASDLGVTENNLYVRLHRARKALRTSLERSCGTCAEHGCLNCTCG
ncbi:MAG: RNA polymerase sigma factor [Oligoflexales bacterium]